MLLFNKKLVYDTRTSETKETRGKNKKSKCISEFEKLRIRNGCKIIIGATRPLPFLFILPIIGHIFSCPLLEYHLWNDCIRTIHQNNGNYNKYKNNTKTIKVKKGDSKRPMWYSSFSFSFFVYVVCLTTQWCRCFTPWSARMQCFLPTAEVPLRISWPW